MFVNAGRGAGHEGQEQHGQHAAGFAEIVEHFIEARGLRRILGQLEGRRLIDVLVGAIDQRPEVHERGLQLVLLQVLEHGGHRAGGIGAQFLRTRGHHAIAIAFEHGERTVDEIAQTVGQLGLIARGESGVGPVAVGSDVQLAHDEETKGIDAPFLNHGEGIDDVAGALADLGAVLLPPAVDEQLFGQRQSRRLEHDGPIDGVEFEDVFADDVEVGGPEGELGDWSREMGVGESVAHRSVAVGSRDADVIHQRVEPHVSDEARIEGQGDAPVEPGRGTRNAQVGERVIFEEAQYFVAPVGGLHEVGVLLNMRDEPGLVVLELEVVVLLDERDDLAPRRIKSAVGQAVLLREKGLFLERIESLVRLLVEMAFALKAG